MKKIILILALVLLVTGCTIEKLDDSSIDNVVNTVLTKNTNSSNAFFKGFKYYLPRGMSLLKKEEYNSVILSNNYKFYLYVDIVSYYNKVEFDYETTDGFYSKKINYGGKAGYVEITEKDEKYFIEVMFNYAKIEAYVDKENLSISLIRICQVLSSIQYNNSIIDTLVGENKLDYKETVCDVFTSRRKTGDFLQYEKDYGTYVEPSDGDKDIVLDTE